MSIKPKGSIDEPHEQWVGIAYAREHGLPGFPPPRRKEDDPRRAEKSAKKRAAALRRWEIARAAFADL